MKASTIIFVVGGFLLNNKDVAVEASTASLKASSLLVQPKQRERKWNWGAATYTYDHNIKILRIGRGGGQHQPISTSTSTSTSSEKIDDPTEKSLSKEKAKKEETNQANEQYEAPIETTSISSPPNPTKRDYITKKVDDFLRTRIYSSPASSSDNNENNSDTDTGGDTETVIETINSNNVPITPQKLLHQIAPKLPPIKKSPDYLLKIRSASPEDAGLAAYAIGVIAGATDVFEKHYRRNRHKMEDSALSSSDIFVEDLVKDRRWEQMVECVLCGVDVKKRVEEFMKFKQKQKIQKMETKIDATQINNHDLSYPQLNTFDSTTKNVDQTKDQEEYSTTIVEGLNVADASRAAWGLSILGVQHHVDTLGGETPHDILISLSLRCRDILNYQWKSLLDTQEHTSSILDMEASIVDGWDQSQQNLAQDAAQAMWAFACVKACTNVRSDFLFHTCCDILSGKLISEQNFKVKRLKQEEVLDRLAKNQLQDEKQPFDKTIKQDQNKNEQIQHNETVSSYIHNQSTPMINHNHTTMELSKHLKPIELANVIWALAVHNNNIEETKDDSQIVNSISNQIRLLLETDLAYMKSGEDIIRSVKDTNAMNEEESDEKQEEDKKEMIDQETLNPANHVESTLSYHSPTEDQEIINSLDEETIFDVTTTEEIEITSKIENGVISNVQDEEASFHDSTSYTSEQAVEVIDAAALLEGDSTVEREILHLNNNDDINIASSSNVEEDQYGIQVIDAAALLRGDEDVEAETLRVEVDQEEESIESNANDFSSKNENALNHNNVTGASSTFDSDIQMEAQPLDPVELDAHEDRGTGKEAKNSTDVEDKDISIPRMKTSFTSKDLCAIVWAVTELQWRPSSKLLTKETSNEYEKIVYLIVTMFSKIIDESNQDENNESVSSMQGVDFSDLTSLAWAMAKYVKGTSVSRAMTQTEEAHISIVTQQIIHSSMERLEIANRSSDDEQIVPPILSRLMWSLTTIFRETKSGKGSEIMVKNLRVLQKLSTACIYEAESNLSSYRVEDLARLMWAHSEFSDFTQSHGTSERHRLNLALGRMQNTIESSLLRWELGRSSQIFDESSIWNIPMFERSSSSIPLKKLESSRTSAAEEDGFDDDDNDRKITNSEHNRPGRRLLPSLESAPIDPSTLCKVSFACTKLADVYMSHTSTFQMNPGKGAEDLARIAARIFTYSGESLLSQCHPHDIARLCYAYTRTAITSSISSSDDDRSMCNSETREALTRHFTKRVVQIINDSTITKNENQESVSIFESMAPNYLSYLIWSLGELGVQCSYSNVSDNGKTSSRTRKMKLRAKRPNLSLNQLKEMSSWSILNLLCGIIGLDDITNDIDLIDSILSDMEKNKLSSFSPSACCRAVHILTKLRNSVLDICGASELSVADTSEIEIKDTKPSDKSEKEDDNDLVELISSKEEVVIEDPVKNVSTLLTHCNQILSSLSTKITAEVPRFTASQLRKILQAYHIMPFQADEMIHTIETEVKYRVSELAAVSAMSSESSGNNSNGNILSLIRKAADRFVDATSMLSQIYSENNNEEELLSSSSSSSDYNDENRNTEHYLDHESFMQLREELSNVKGHMDRAIAVVCEAATRLERVEKGAVLSVESSLKNVEYGVAFELGRCLELIDLYRLLEFQSGTRRARFTGGKKKTVMKHILSRLFQ